MVKNDMATAGRPSVDPAKKRSMFVGMNLTPVEHKIFMKIVESSGMSMSDFFRSKFKKELR